MHLDDLAALVAHHKASAEKQFQSEISKLVVAHGSRLVGKALELAARRDDQRAAISIAAARMRYHEQRAAERRRAQYFRDQPHGDEPAGASRLPPGWR